MESGPVEHGLPLPVGPKLQTSELQPADILLKRSNNPLATLIVACDRGSYSHAALWSGERIIEAGVTRRIEAGLKRGGTGHFTGESEPAGAWGVYRFWPDRDNPPGLPPAAAETIVSRAKDHLCAAYNDKELMFVALAFAFVRHRRPTKPLVDALAPILGERGEKCLQFLQERYEKGTAPRMCSELVAMAYYSADYTRRYALRVLQNYERPSPSNGPPEVGSVKILQTVMTHAVSRSYENIRTSFRNLTKAQARTAASWFGHLALLADGGGPVGVVTPGDIQFAENLNFVGNIEW